MKYICDICKEEIEVEYLDSRTKLNNSGKPQGIMHGMVAYGSFRLHPHCAGRFVARHLRDIAMGIKHPIPYRLGKFTLQKDSSIQKIQDAFNQVLKRTGWQLSVETFVQYTDLVRLVAKKGMMGTGAECSKRGIEIIKHIVAILNNVAELNAISEINLDESITVLVEQNEYL